MRQYAGEFVAGLFLLAIVYVLVRPRSKGVELVTGVGAALTAITNAATDLANPGN